MNIETNITERELDFYETLHYPVALAECLFSGKELEASDNLAIFNEDFAEIRLHQYPLLSFEYLLGYDSKLSGKENFQLREGAGTIYVLGGRKYGKTLITEKIDLCLAVFLLDAERIGFTSMDAMHIRGVLEDVIRGFEQHPILKQLGVKVNRSPSYRITFKAGTVIEGINMNLAGKRPGEQFFQKHFSRLYIEEACVDGHTKIKCVDQNGNYFTKKISDLINSGSYNRARVLSYNFDTKKVEPKKITKIFKKQVKNYTNYKIEVHPNSNHNKRTLVASKGQKIWTRQGYKLPKELTLNDEICLLDYVNLSKIQKSILLGCLLGDAHLTNFDNPSLVLVQGKKQKDYLKYKINCFSSLFKFYRKKKNYGIVETNSISGKSRVLRIKSKPNKILQKYIDLKFCLVNKSKTKLNLKFIEQNLDPIALAFWYMDDGSLQKQRTKKGFCNSITLHTEGYDLETNQGLANILNQKFDLNVKICISKKKLLDGTLKNYYYLFLNKDSTSKFLKLVSKYIYPSMSYKLPEQKSFRDLESFDYEFQYFKISKISPSIKSSWTMYDIEVEDNHNFFGNEILISNSFEPDLIYKKRIDSVSEKGCIVRAAGMTNFTKHSPVGRIFYDLKNQPQIVNLPQKVSPKWGKKENLKALKEHGGEKSISYRVFVNGEVVEEGVSVIDMERVRRHYKENKEIQHLEITKDNFHNFEEILIVHKYKNASSVYITADIGESAPTEIVVLFEVPTQELSKYHYEYNITLYNLTDKQQFKVFKYLAEQLNANFVGIDTSDGTGRAIYRSLEEVMPKDNLVWVHFAEKLPVGFDKDKNGQVIFKNGIPVQREEYVSEWSIKHLKNLLYDGRIPLPLDYRLDVQLNSLISMQSGNRTIYTCVSEEDHLLQAFQVFSISQWKNEFNQNRPHSKKKFGKFGVFK